MLVEVLIHTPRLIPLMAQYISSNYQFLFLFFTIIILFRKQFYLMHFLRISAWTSEDAFTKYEVLLFIRHPLPFMSGCLSSMVEQIFFKYHIGLYFFFSSRNWRIFSCSVFLVNSEGWRFDTSLVSNYYSHVFYAKKLHSFYSTVIICKFYFAWT